MELIEVPHEDGITIYIEKGSIVFFTEGRLSDYTIVQLRTGFELTLEITTKEFLELLKSKPI